MLLQMLGLPWWLSGKESTCQAGDVDLIPGLGRFPGEGNGNPLQYSCLGNPMDRGAWRAIAFGVKKELDTLSPRALPNKCSAAIITNAVLEESIIQCVVMSR